VTVRAGLAVCLMVLGAATAQAQDAQEDVSAKQKFVVELQQAVRADDRRWLADHMQFPLRHNGRRKTLIRSRAAFLKDYASVFTARLRACVLAHDAKDLFGNWQGIMLGNGCLWFRNIGDAVPERYRIVTINDMP